MSRWSSYWSIRDAWQDYREEYTQYWHMVDDKDTGEFYIESYDPETENLSSQEENGIIKEL